MSSSEKYSRIENASSLRVGDKVRYCIEPKDKAVSLTITSKVPEGTDGVIVGFSKCPIFSVDAVTLPEGIYIMNHNPLVLFEGQDKPIPTSSFELEYLGEDLAERLSSNTRFIESLSIQRGK